MNETALIHDAMRGDLEAFNRLVLAFQDLVYNQAFRMMGERHAAEDATQTAFILAYRKLSGFHGGSFKAWLLRIVSNACYDELRRRNAHPSVPIEPVNESGEEYKYPYWLTDNSPAPEEQLERRELAEAIQRCLENVTPEYREVLILVDVQGMSYLEAAEAMGKPIGTIKSRLARGRMHLGTELRNYWDLLPPKYRSVPAAARS